MKRMCCLLKVKKEKLNEYLQAHQVWPEMLEAMRNAGIRNYSMYFREDGLLVGYFEAEDPERSLRECAATDVSKRWNKYMAPFFEPVWLGKQPGELLVLEEYFLMM